MIARTAFFFIVVLVLALAPVDLTLRGKECRVKTDLKPALAKPVTEQIDNYCANFEAFYDGLGLEARTNNKVLVRLFAEYEDFTEFYHRNSPDRDPPAAYFSPSLNGVVCYYDPDDPYLRQVLFHETSHQYLERYTSWAPKWLNEGLAEYFEGWRLAPDGKLIEKRPPFYDLLVLQKALAGPKEAAGERSSAETTDNLPTHLAPQELVEMAPQTFMDFREAYQHLDGYLHYATSWGMTWYFLEGPDEEDRARYLAYLRSLSEDGQRAEPLAFEDWDAFETRWKEFIVGIEVAPETADDHLILAANLRDEKEYAAAIQEYAAALKLAPETPGATFWLGYCYKRTGNYDEATPHLLKAAKDDEDDARPLYQLARIASRMDREEKDGADLAQALEYAREASARLDDKHPVYLSLVAQCQHLSGDVKGAKKTMAKVLKLVKDEDDDVKARYQQMLDEM